MPLHCWLLIILFPIATGATKQKRTTTFSCKVPLPLGMESGAITDAQLSASSSFEASSLGPQNGRIRLESGGGAWCPSRQIDADTSVEFIQVDLLEPFEIWAVEIQGRYGNGSGREFAEALTIDYIGEGQQNWTRYTIASSTAGDDDEQQQQQETSLELEQVQQVFPANRDERTAELIPLVPPLLAVSVRLVPFSAQLRTVCLRFELYGCPAAGNANANDKLRFRDDNVNSIAGETVQSRGGTFSQLGEHVMARPALLYPLVALVSLLPLLLLLLLFFRWRLLLHRQRDNNGSNNKLSFFSCTSTCSSSNSNAHPLRPSSSWQNVLLPFGCVEQQSGGCSSAKIFSPSFCRFDTVSLGWPSLNRVNSNCTKTAATNWSNSFWQPQQMKISKSMITAPLMAAANQQQQQRPIPLPIPTAIVHSHSSSDGRFAVTRQATATQQPPQLIRAKKPIPKPRSSTTLLNKQQQKPGNTRN